ncbi:alpha/beta hydrolase fold domain-containing protein [Hymenobacter busanensis]|uniref:Alpha/beta hydrolase fold domain-containing protein n=1 Tax=Hymenobacter busanensis TaxID=2607656 RepID=A0A7L4ZX02_9BACT|nr:alpha/beta hydrolase fold domain-containing protein [Hymenobacter busanensis]KAA9325557.1 alpha/beta hydrolase fold domain-containing protein [Hymenobacter busanensis]QHJ07771.1 alpha/beta hydrolase fold domain-containing protein [Hymenobacter busanensis]
MKSTLQRALFFGFAWLIMAGSVQAQIDTTGGQFYQPLYASVTITRDVPFGAAVNAAGNPQTLLLDVYEPVGGPAGLRPLIILAHGGAFLFGSRGDYDVAELCTRFARLGYVTASIDYRLEPSPFSYSGPRAVVQAMYDMRAAVRFFRRDAAGSNPFRINPAYVFVGGSSAGAITALHTAFLDKPAELASIYPVAPEGLEGNSGNAGFSSSVLAAINLCGALGNPAWIEAGDEPFVSLHGTADPVVPYTSGVVFGNLLYGSGALKPRADAVSVPNTLYPFKNAGHVPYNGTNATQLAYMDTTFRVVRNFLRPFLGQAVVPPLPVTLTRFEAVRQGHNAVLRWETVQEADNRGYEVQVSADGQQFRALGFVASADGNSRTRQRYQFEDAEAGKSGRRYYRLRQEDVGGKSSFYGPRVVVFDESLLEVAVYPNPVLRHTTPTVQLTTAGAGPAQLRLHNAHGKLLFDKSLQLTAGQYRIALPTTLPAGVYVLEVEQGLARQQRKLVVQ